MSESGIVGKWISWAPYFQSILRIVAGFMFMTAGTTILFAFPSPMPGGAQVELLSQTGIGGLLELVGGALMLVGLFTRPVAFVLSGEMAVAYFQFHAPQSFWPTINMGMPAALFSLVFLWFSAAGAGPWSLDALRSRSGASRSGAR
jgi:putative oxidoreductase